MYGDGFQCQQSLVMLKQIRLCLKPMFLPASVPYLLWWLDHSNILKKAAKFGFLSHFQGGKMYTYMIEVRRKMFKLGKTNDEFSQLPAMMCFQKSKSCSCTCHLVLRDKFCSCQGWVISISAMAAWWQAQKRMRNRSIRSLFQSLLIWCLLLMPLQMKSLYFWCRTSSGDSELVVLRKK